MTETSIQRLTDVDLHDGEAALSWFGQASFAARGGGITVLFDPFLSPYDGRLHASPLAPEEALGIDVVLCSHEHVDHLDVPSIGAIASASPGATFVVPSPIVDMLTEAGVPGERVVGVQPGDPIDVGGLTVRAVPACHGVTMDDAYGFGEDLSGGLIRFVGFVVDLGGVRIYHAGDTIHFDGMESMLEPLEIDVALLPINGRDAVREARGIVGNLDPHDAAWLASNVGAGALIPMHHDMFARNLGFPGVLVETAGREFPEVPVVVPARDRPFVTTKRTSTG